MQTYEKGMFANAFEYIMYYAFGCKFVPHYTFII